MISFDRFLTKISEVFHSSQDRQVADSGAFLWSKQGSTPAERSVKKMCCCVWGHISPDFFSKPRWPPWVSEQRLPQVGKETQHIHTDRHELTNNLQARLVAPWRSTRNGRWSVLSVAICAAMVGANECSEWKPTCVWQCLRSKNDNKQILYIYKCPKTCFVFSFHWFFLGTSKTYRLERAPLPNCISGWRPCTRHWAQVGFGPVVVKSPLKPQLTYGSPMFTKQKIVVVKWC